MLTIHNTYNDAIVFSDQIDASAEGYLQALCGQALSEGSKIRIMPDVHAGKGCVIGTTMTISDRVCPGFVGVDIGCGITVCKIHAKRVELQKLDKVVHEKIPAGRAIRRSPHRFAERLNLEALRCARHIQSDKARCSIGTLGGGNHFIELDRGDDGSYYLILHSGSRHLGAEVSTYYQDAAFHASPEGTAYVFACATGTLFTDYLHDLAIVQDFAEQNRRAMADEIARSMKFDVVETFSTVHNYIDTEDRILRKGAVAAKAGARLIIPMNMRDGCLLCEGKGNPDWNQSAPHGAGRLMSRADARQSLTLSQFKKEMRGIYSTSICRETLDESPMAYKPMETICAQIEPTVQVLERIVPVYNFKAGVEI